jgi:hypothetical protein
MALEDTFAGIVHSPQMESEEGLAAHVVFLARALTVVVG